MEAQQDFSAVTYPNPVHRTTSAQAAAETDGMMAAAGQNGYQVTGRPELDQFQ